MSGITLKQEMALMRGEEVEMSDSALAHLRKWTPPYVEIKVRPIRPGRHLVSTLMEEE